MKNVLSIAVIAALAACGGRTPAEAQLPDGMGGVRVELHGATAPGTTMGEIIIQNVFDPSQTLLQNCIAKPETLDGQAFCDNMNILQPGVYEIKVESQTGCKMTQDHYKVQVVAGQTTEVTIPLVCDAGAATGGLDVVVTENHAPQIDGLSFNFYDQGGTPANKFMCANGGVVEALLIVEDAETPCDQLTVQWSVNGIYFTWPNMIPPVLNVYTNPVPVAPGSNVCRLGELIDPSSVPLGDYTLDVALTDAQGLTTKFSWPIHIIPCP